MLRIPRLRRSAEKRSRTPGLSGGVDHDSTAANQSRARPEVSNVSQPDATAATAGTENTGKRSCGGAVQRRAAPRDCLRNDTWSFQLVSGTVVLEQRDHPVRAQALRTAEVRELAQEGEAHHHPSGPADQLLRGEGS